MTYEEFIEEIRKRALKAAGKGGSVFINRVIKNNNVTLEGLVILEKGSHISPAIYLNEYYRMYEEGETMDNIMNKILIAYYETKDTFSLEPSYFNSFDKVKDKVVYKIINKDRNEKLLKMLPHDEILDLAIVYYCVVSHYQGSYATALIYNSHLKMWDITFEELKEAAIINTPVLQRSVIRPVGDVLGEMMGDEVRPGLGNGMYVLTNEDKFNGASCMFYDNILEQFSSIIKSDLYILPSSVHEVIMLPKTDAIDKKDLNMMVKKINISDVAEYDILSDHVYEYSYKNKKIIM